MVWITVKQMNPQRVIVGFALLNIQDSV